MLFLNSKRMFISLAAFWVLFLMILSACKSLGYGYVIWGSIETYLGGNRQLHFVFAFVLSFLCHNAIYCGKPLIVFNPCVGILILGCAADECLQFFLPTRHFSILDMVASIIGVVAGLFFYFLLNKFQTSSR